MAYRNVFTRLLMLKTLLNLFGCATTQTIYTGTFNNETYALCSVETKGFSTNSISYELKLSRWKSVRIDALTTDWGAPYADDLYGDARRMYSSPEHTAYRNEPDNFIDHQATMLYLSPSRFPAASFTYFVDFMKTEWPKIDRQFATHAYSRFPHIIGLVYGEQPDFVRTFRGNRAGKKYLIRVEPDGRVRYMVDGQGSLAQLRTYTDKAGNTLSDYFQLMEKL